MERTLKKGVSQILSTLDTKKISLIYFIISLVIMNFGFIYEMFSHGVYSNYMMFAFLIPFLLGSMLFHIVGLLKVKVSILSLNFYHSFVSTLTLGCIIKGFLDIYGTTNSLISIYIYVSIMLLVLSIVFVKKGVL